MQSTVEMTPMREVREALVGVGHALIAAARVRVEVALYGLLGREDAGAAAPDEAWLVRVACRRVHTVRAALGWCGASERVDVSRRKEDER